MRSFLAIAVALASVTAACSKAKEDDPQATLAFVVEGKEARSLSLKSLTHDIAVEEIQGYDPYYNKDKRFRALPLKRILQLGFPGITDLQQKEFILRAKDGYAAYFRGALATDEGAYVAFEDRDVAGWEPIGPQKANPAPFYVVWSKPEQKNLETHPRPWQLAKIEMVRFDEAYPHTSPGPLPEGAPAALGYRIFRDQCFKCHAINREGGRVGPELNVPQNILEYRPEAQVRAYIKNPGTFRFSNMPAHPDLKDADLDALVAYFGAMKEKKFVPKN